MRALLDDEAAGGDDPADKFTETVHRAVGVPRHVIEQFERMTADGEAEQLRFTLETFAPRRLMERSRRQSLEAGRRQKPRLAGLIRRGESFQEMLRLPELPGARLTELVQRAGADHGFDFFAGWSDALNKVGDGCERTALTRGEQPVRGARGQPLHAGQRHAEQLSVRDERRPRFVDGWRKEFQAEPVAFQHIDQRMIEALPVRQHARHELRRMIPLQPRRLIRLDPVGRAVRLVEGVAGKARHERPHLDDLRFAMSARTGAGEELAANLLHDLPLLLHQRAAQHVGPAGGQARERFADLQDVLFIHHQPIGAAQARLQRRVRIRHRLQALIAAREGQLLRFVGRAGTDDGDDGDQSVDLPHVRHAVQRRHGGRFDVMHRPRSAAGDHLPHLRILPRLQRCEVHDEAAPGQRVFRIAHHRQAALREDVHLHQADGLHGIHVVMRGGPSLVRDERGSQLVHGLAREHDAARMHLRITRHAVEERRHLHRGLVRLLVQRQRAGFGAGAQ